MIWLLLGFIILYCIANKDDPEYDAKCYVGPYEFDKAKETMSDKEFKKFVKENSQKMKKRMDDAAAYHKLSPEEKQKIIDHTVKLHEERMEKELIEFRKNRK